MRRRNILKGIGVTAGAFVVSTANAELTPDERINDAIAELEAALKEKYPAWDVNVKGPDFWEGSIYPSGEKYRYGEVVVVSAFDTKHSMGRNLTATFDEPLEAMYADDRPSS